MNTTLTKFLNLPDSSYTPLIRVLFGLSSPGAPDISSVTSIQFTDPSLNSSQKDAIRFALSSPDIALIHGPPGTGKTHTLIELIVQLVLLNPLSRILVCGPSNISVDNIVERLALLPHSHPSHNSYKKPTFLRLGHPARLLPSVLLHSLEVLTQTSDAAQLVSDIRTEIDTTQASIRKTRNARERRGIYAELKELRKEYRVREGKCVDDLIRGAQVVLATLHGSGGHQLRNTRFDVVIVDEASQALEAQCWIPLLMTGGPVGKLILAGDHLQLPPTIKSIHGTKDKADMKKSLALLDAELAGLDLSEKEKKGAHAATLERTMFDRLLALHGPSIKTLLTTQYRMHESIMRFPSDELYDAKLIAADPVKARRLINLPYPVQDTDDTREPLVFYDTQGGDYPERREDDHKTSPLLFADSKSNPAEAAVVMQHVARLIDAGVREADIAVITPYNGQLGVLSGLGLKERWPGVELGSVDGFQGREKECVVVSLVRSNREGEVGFLGERRRLNGMFGFFSSLCLFLTSAPSWVWCPVPLAVLLRPTFLLLQCTPQLLDVNTFAWYRRPCICVWHGPQETCS
jgi:DNA polymerase alpha-associated DNA helicase A